MINSYLRLTTHKGRETLHYLQKQIFHFQYKVEIEVTRKNHKLFHYDNYFKTIIILNTLNSQISRFTSSISIHTFINSINLFHY